MTPDDLKVLNKSLSESVNLFQAIHVLQSKEDELAFGNETVAGTYFHNLRGCSQTTFTYMEERGFVKCQRYLIDLANFVK